MVGHSSKSPKADRATLDRVSKLLPLLNSSQPGEAQAAAAALAKYDLRDVAASLQNPMRSSAVGDSWYERTTEEMRLRLQQLQQQAQTMLGENSPLLTKIDRGSLHKILQLKVELRGGNESRVRRDLEYWSGRLRAIRWKTTPGAKELENALSVAAHHTQHAKNHVRGVFDPKHRATISNAIGIAQTALTKAAETLRQMKETAP